MSRHVTKILKIFIIAVLISFTASKTMSKSREEALKYRTVGNNFYKQKDFKNAEFFYNFSIRTSHFEDLNYFYSLGNKSALLFQMKQFKNSEEIIAAMLNSAAFSDLFLSNKGYIEKLKKRSFGCQEHLDNACNETDCSQFNNDISLKTICFEKSVTAGNYVAAGVPLKPNDTIYQTDSFAAALGSQFWVSHCYCCFKFIGNTIIVPCEACSDVQFCSVLCRDKHKIHKIFECGDSDFVKNIGLFHLAVNVLLSFENLPSKLGKLIHSFDHQKLDLSDYKESERDVLQLFKSASVAKNIWNENSHVIETIYLKLNEKLPVFHGYTKDSIKRLLVSIGCQMTMNASTIKYYDEGSGELIAIGAGIYPSIAKMNHSCYSNTVCIFDGTTAVVKAYQWVDPGSELFNSYGFDFESTLKADRQVGLRMQYEFDCFCDPCSYSWCRDDSERKIYCQKCFTSLSLSAYNSSCTNCSADLAEVFLLVQSLEEKFNEAYKLFQLKKYQKVLEFMTHSKARRELKVLALPDSLLLDWNDLIKKAIICVFYKSL